MGVPENLERWGLPPCVTIGILRPHFGAKKTRMMGLAGDGKRLTMRALRSGLCAA